MMKCKAVQMVVSVPKSTSDPLSESEFNVPWKTHEEHSAADDITITCLNKNNDDDG